MMKMNEEETLMAAAPKSFRPSPSIDQALAHNGGSRGMSHRLSQISDRYMEILRRAHLPEFSDGEWNLLRDATNGTLYEPASHIAHFDHGIGDAIELDELDRKWDVDGEALLTKLRGLTFVQEVALLEQIEAWWAAQ